MRRLVAFALAACGSQQGAPPPPLTAVDRSCTVDADCVFTGPLDCCDFACGANPGTPVNAKTWSKVGAKYQPDCRRMECNVMCPKLPDCRDEPVAVCKAGRCEKGMRRTAACNDPLACASAADCTMQTLGEDCCDRCDGPVMNRKAHDTARAARVEQCASKAPTGCPRLDCPAPRVDCIDERCVKR